MGGQRACRWAEGVYVGWGRVGGLRACRWAGGV